MKTVFKFLALAVLAMIGSGLFAQGVTTAGMNGKVVDADGNPLPGATVKVEETSSGTMYGTISDSKGFYHLPNMNVGGPYQITISYVDSNLM